MVRRQGRIHELPIVEIPLDTEQTNSNTIPSILSISRKQLTDKDLSEAYVLVLRDSQGCQPAGPRRI